jgi:hypothetical protein
MRIAIFCLFGPPLGAICMFALGVAANPSGVTSGALQGLFFVVLFSYLPGFAPAILTCQADDYLSDKLARWPRAAVTSLVGAAVTVAWLSLVVGTGRWVGLEAALLGAIPAAVCSWLSDRWKSESVAGETIAAEGRRS